MASKSKGTRGYGDFASTTTASSLFDSAFSKAPVTSTRKRFAKFPTAAKPPVPDEVPVILPSVAERPTSPRQVFSPPVSLPESTSTDGAQEQDNNIELSDGEDEITFKSRAQSSSSLIDHAASQSSTDSINRHMSTLMDSPTSSGKRTRPTSSNVFDFDDDSHVAEQPLPAKMSKITEVPSFSNRGNDRRPIYQHKWNDNEDEDDHDSGPSSSGHVPAGVVALATRYASGSTISQYSSRSRIKNVKGAHQCLESGEYDDFKQDLEYILSTLNGEATINLKCLSAISLAKKCISTEFRQFIRSEGQVGVVMRAMADSPQNPSFALCASAVIYFMARDFISMKIDSFTLKLFSQLLRIEDMGTDSESVKYKEQVWKVFTDYLTKMEASGKKVVFDFESEQFAPSMLVLEALVFALAKNPSDAIKAEMLNFGILQWIVCKVEKVYDNFSISTALHDLQILERCFRILETCTVYHKKNQAFLVSHRSNILILTCGKLLELIHKNVDDPDQNNDEKLLRQYMACMSLLARVLINLSHENELASTKLGQVPGFLSLCLSSFTYLTAKYATDDKKYDILVMMCSLMINLVERCNSNRRKVMEMTLKVFNVAEKETTEETGMDALTKMFCIHEEKARNMDEDLDRELAFEDPGSENENDGNSDDDDDEPKAGKLDRGKLQLEEMSEAEMLHAVQNAMGKASAHMEDSVVASYLSLLIGCLLQQNEEYVDAVKALLPQKSLSPMIEQLQRFLDFMKVATSRAAGCRSIERIIDLLEKLD